MEFMVRRHTTDQLERALNSFAADGWEVLPPYHMGARDWVVICRRGEVAA
jgi:hypothetical protein